MKIKFKLKLLSLLLSVIIFTVVGCTSAMVITPGISSTSAALSPLNSSTSSVSANPVLTPDSAVQWMDLICTTIEAEKLPPPEASRIIAYTGVTLYETVLPALFRIQDSVRTAK